MSLDSSVLLLSLRLYRPAASPPRSDGRTRFRPGSRAGNPAAGQLAHWARDVPRLERSAFEFTLVSPSRVSSQIGREDTLSPWLTRRQSGRWSVSALGPRCP